MNNEKAKGCLEIFQNDFRQLYNFEEKDGQIVGPKIKFPSAVYDRINAFHTEDAMENGWTMYGIIQCILGNVDEKDYWLNPVAEEASLKPPKEFAQWLEEHYAFGPTLIMLAVVYNNYELED